MRSKIFLLTVLGGFILAGCSGGDSSASEGTIGDTASNVAADSNSESEAFKPPEGTIIESKK